MRTLTRLTRVAALGFLAVLAAGCGPSAPPTEAAANDSAALNELAEAYRLYSIAKNAPPRKPADLQAVEMIGGNGVVQAMNGEIIVQWGAPLPDIKEEPGQSTAPEVLAYGQDVPKEGGYVLLLDRTVKEMTAEEFEAAPKAPGDPAPSTPKTTKKR